MDQKLIVRAQIVRTLALFAIHWHFMITYAHIHQTISKIINLHNVTVPTW